MLYPKNKEKELSPALYANPTAEYRGAPFWAWNCHLEQKELLWQMDVLHQMGFGGGHMHVRTGMDTPYLSDEYMDLISACVHKAKRDKMLAWLYDEDRWPSGAAGGLVTKDPQYRQKYLLFTPTPYAGRECEGSTDSSARAGRAENGTLLARFAVHLNADGSLASYRMLKEGEEGDGDLWYAYLETALPNPWYNNQTYVNTLDPKAIRRFLEVTHERYASVPAIRKAFGKTIPSIFTDEPQFTRKSTLAFAASRQDVTLPWTDDLEETYRAVYGEELIAHIPELIWEQENGVSTTRYHYHDHIAERFSEAFADQCGAWCREHGLMLTGHMMEEPTLLSQTAALGEAMRSYRGFDLPGIDMLCGWFEYTTAKQCQSAVHQFGREGMLSELYGVTGWDFDFRGHKLHGDWQAALGVTVRVPHLSWVSMKGEAKRDYPASISYQSSWWTEYSYVENHFARVNTAMTRGTPVVRVGVIHPVESYWLHWGPAEQTAAIREEMDGNFRNVTRWLLQGSVDFDFISESLLPLQCKKGGAPLKVGKMAYDAIVVPQCETLRSTTLERLEAFRKAGGRLIFMGEAPRYENAVPSKRGQELYDLSEKVAFGHSSILAALNDFRTVELRSQSGSLTSNLLYQLRKDGDSQWLFVAHGEEPYNKDLNGAQAIRISVKGEWTPALYNTVDGTTAPVAFRHENGHTVIDTVLYAYDSLLLHYTHTEATALPAEKEKDFRPLQVPELVPFRLSEPNVLLLDKAEYALDKDNYRSEEELLRADNAMRRALGWPQRGAAVAQPWVIPPEKPEHTVRLRFKIHSEVRVLRPYLALEDADIAKIMLNDTPVTAKPEGYYTDKSIGKVALPPIPVGDSTIEVLLPFGRRTNVEWCYLLGNFGVRVEGERRVLTLPPKLLGFDSITGMGLPHYGGIVHYDVPVESHGGEVIAFTPHYRAGVISVEVDGEKAGHIAYPPYAISLGELPAGKHTITFSLYLSRHNAFGAVHCADEKCQWKGPGWWRTDGDSWTDSYRLLPEGLLTAPRILEDRKEH